MDIVKDIELDLLIFLFCPWRDNHHFLKVYIKNIKSKRIFISYYCLRNGCVNN